MIYVPIGAEDRMHLSPWLRVPLVVCNEKHMGQCSLGTLGDRTPVPLNLWVLAVLGLRQLRDGVTKSPIDRCAYVPIVPESRQSSL